MLRDFSGRPPARYRAAGGEWLNDIEITHALRDVALPQWTMHQHADGSVVYRHSGRTIAMRRSSRILLALLGGVLLRTEEAKFEDGKVVQYTSVLT